MRVVAWIWNNRGAFRVWLHVRVVQSEQELRWIVALLKKRMAGWTIAVQALALAIGMLGRTGQRD